MTLSVVVWNMNLKWRSGVRWFSFELLPSSLLVFFLFLSIISHDNAYQFSLLDSEQLSVFSTAYGVKSLKREHYQATSQTVLEPLFRSLQMIYIYRNSNGQTLVFVYTFNSWVCFLCCENIFKNHLPQTMNNESYVIEQAPRTRPVLVMGGLHGKTRLYLKRSLSPPPSPSSSPSQHHCECPSELLQHKS